tara:strand:+ start:17393 stop:17632 length:240 start_codon:yes stop_codon:yes gene_type:complete
MNKAKTMEPQGVSEKQAAERWPYSVKWYQKMRHIGGGPPYIKVGNRVIYPIVQLDCWFREHGLRYSTAEQRGGKNDSSF